MVKKYALVFCFVFTGCYENQKQIIEVRCDPPPVIENAFTACLSNLAQALNDKDKCFEDLVFYKRNYCPSME